MAVIVEHRRVKGVVCRYIERRETLSLRTVLGPSV
jgi:hypothetical protein